MLCALALVPALVAASASPWELVALAVATLAAATLAGWIVTESLLRLAMGLQTDLTKALPATGWVGLVERFGFTLSLVLGFPEVAALLIGVKALGTYSSSKRDGNRGAAARVLGTLTSISWALLTTTAYLLVSRTNAY